MKRAAAIVTDSGGRTCHAAIVAREIGVPAIVGTQRASSLLQEGQTVTISCAEGSEGKIYEGAIPFSVEEVPVMDGAHPLTRIMMNVGKPDTAFTLAALPNEGVGLARVEFIIANGIRVHPLALTRFETVKDPQVRAQIEELTHGYDDKREFFIDRMAQGVATIGAAFWPKPVIVRFSDFKTNEYRNLIGGAQFEPVEENPMLGWRGASRYYDPGYRDAFAMECAAIRRVRNEMGLGNVEVMVPFCRTPEEGVKVLEEMTRNGLERGSHGLKVLMMCEIPSNVLLADKFAKMFDGFSIGSNDLTQLVLGVDRDSALVAPLFDERNPAVKQMISIVVNTAHAAGISVGICGQAPSDYPEFLEFLLQIGIDSVSLNSDSVVDAWQRVLKFETR